MKKQYITLFIKIVLICLPFICFSSFCALFPLHYLDGEVAWWLQQKEYGTHDNGENTNILILGDSRAKSAFQPSLMSDDTYNMALGGATSIEMYYSLRNYLETHQKKPKAVIIAFGSFHYSTMDCFWSRSIYFHYFSTSEKIEIFKAAKIFKDKTIIKDSYVSELICYQYYLPNKYSAAIKSMKERFEFNINRYEAVKEARGHTYFGTANISEGVTGEGMASTFIPSDILDFYLVELINLCIDNNIEVIVEQMPFNEATFNAMQNKFKEDYIEYMNSITERFPQITVNTKPYYYTNDCFGDASHLNSVGSEKYTQEIIGKYPKVFLQNNLY